MSFPILTRFEYGNKFEIKTIDYKFRPNIGEALTHEFYVTDDAEEFLCVMKFRIVDVEFSSHGSVCIIAVQK